MPAVDNDETFKTERNIFSQSAGKQAGETAFKSKRSE